MDETHPAAPRLVQVLVEDGAKRRLGYDIDLASVVRSLKQDIEETEGILAYQQCLRFGMSGLELKLEDHCTFRSYGIAEGSIVYLDTTASTLYGTCKMGGPTGYRILDQYPSAEVDLGDSEDEPPTFDEIEELPMERQYQSALPSTTDTIGNTTIGGKPIPASPEFSHSSPPHCFTVPLGERGFSYVQVEVRFKPSPGPADRVHVDVALNCIAAYPRRISSVMLSLEFPENDVKDLYPTDELGRETTMDIETTDNTEVGLNAGMAFQGASAGVGYARGLGESRSVARVTQMKIQGCVKGVSTAFWSLTEDVGQEGGLPHEVPMRFTLGSEPAAGNVFECRVTSVKNGKPTTKYGSQKYPAGVAPRSLAAVHKYPVGGAARWHFFKR